jgi:hypothetical protein
MVTDGPTLPSLDAAPLQFDAPQSERAPSAMSCAMCSQPIQTVYYEAGGNVVCAPCRGRLESSIGRAGKGGRLVRASGLGFLAAAAGAMVYYAIRAATGFEFGLVAILVGYGVGRAVFVGSGRRGGRGYQLLAVALTYFAIATTYVPLALDTAKEKGAAQSSTTARPDSTRAGDDGATAASDSVTTPAAPTTSAPNAATSATPATPKKIGVGGVLLGIAAVIALCAALPVFVGAASPISILILAFGLLQAWRMNKRVELSVTGPYRLAATPPPTPPPRG